MSVIAKQMVSSIIGAMSDRLPPQNIEAEQSILGGLLIDKDAIIKVAQILRPSHFYRTQHAVIYEAILSLFERREPADVVTVADELREKKNLKKAGGEAYLGDLVNMVPTVSNVEAYANIVKEAFIRRELISLANNTSSKAFDGDSSVQELLEKTEKNVFSLSQEHISQDFTPIRDVLAESFQRIEELHQKKSKFRGIPTGFTDIDNLLAGMQDNNLIILAARPSVGKTSLALNIAQYIAVHEQVPVGFFSLESSKEELVDRLLSSQADVDGWKIMTGNLNEKELEKITEAMAILADAPIFIDDTPGARVLDMLTKARRLQMDHGIRMIFVDYMQLAVSRNLENRVQEVAEISQTMKNLARELKCPVFVLSQLSRAVEQRGSARPQLADLRDSGSIEQDADVVMFLHRPDEDDQLDANHMKLTIAKHRNGPVGEVDLVFRGDRTRFYGMDKKHRDEEVSQ